MKTRRLTAADGGAVIHTGLAIVGAGPIGLAIAHRCAKAGIDVLLLESGCEQQDAEHESLNEVVADYIGDSDARTAFHGPQAPLWNAQAQAYGVRCRGLGGSTQAWAGKSAPFDPIDFAQREWVENSGWPIAMEELASYIDEAGEILGLSPLGPEPSFSSAGLRSFHWQFARSRLDRLDIMRFGRDFAQRVGDRANCLLDATVVGMDFDEAEGRITGLEVASLAGIRLKVRPQQVVLAASAIENARLLLSSPSGRAGAALNRHDVVGRYLIDHAGTGIGRIAAADAVKLSRIFGFRSVIHAGRSHMFQHGLALDPAAQCRLGTLNGAVWFAQDRAPDNPWDALERLLRRKSEPIAGDIASVVRGSGLVLRGAAARALASPWMPDMVRRAVVEAALRIAPNTVAVEFQTGGLPHKLSGLSLEAIVETAPRRDNRIVLADKLDTFGQRLPHAHWQPGDVEHRTLRALAQAVSQGFAAQDWPTPDFEQWVSEPAMTPPLIDCAHMMGTTRMAREPRLGVVDTDCRVHGASNLFMAGGSVFPTGGHANPTWMYLAMALRLADRIATPEHRLVHVSQVARQGPLQAHAR